LFIVEGKAMLQLIPAGGRPGY